MSRDRALLAIPEDALAIYRRYGGVPIREVPGRGRRRLVAETEQWLFSNDIASPLSFVNICHTLGIDTVWLRGQLPHSARGHAMFPLAS